ncbi:MAG: acetylglucosamine-6-sulfatase [Candidatus Altiarchaeales archaeon WOR_SM1_79]|nr:MAG: acetylglucosamine-6-sulfatase [Candidatus Altiarchaeales archaeon WOR_SM1_79]
MKFPQSMPQLKKRNIIFILSDDHRFDVIGCLGKHPGLVTPNFDKLVKNGILFKHAYVTTSLCSPNRASVLTSQYAHNHGIINNQTNLSDKILTFPQLLQKDGYKTAFVGKWHMGSVSDDPRPGFDRWVSFRGQGVYFDPLFNIDGEHIKREGYITNLITEYSVDFIKNNKDRPFFLYMSHKAVHSGFNPPPRYKGKYKNIVVPKPKSYADTDENYKGKPEWVRKQRKSNHGVDMIMNGTMEFDEFYRNYCECVLGLDDSIGILFDTLEKEGLLEDTLIIYMGDNGYQFGEHGLVDKRTMYETSILVPFIVHCPALAQSGQTRNEFVLNIDIGPTFLDAAGITIPSSFQGRSILPLIKGEKIDWRKEFLYEYFWERAYPMTPTIQGIRTEKYSYMRYHGIWDVNELYDMENDSDQMNNLIGYLPKGSRAQGAIIKDPKLKQIVDELDKRLDELIITTGGTIL